MSKSIKLLVAVSFAGLVAACTTPEPEPVYVDPEPVSMEPVYTGKYK